MAGRIRPTPGRIRKRALDPDMRPSGRCNRWSRTCRRCGYRAVLVREPRHPQHVSPPGRADKPRQRGRRPLPGPCLTLAPQRERRKRVECLGVSSWSLVGIIFVLPEQPLVSNTSAGEFVFRVCPDAVTPNKNAHISKLQGRGGWGNGGTPLSPRRVSDHLEGAIDAQHVVRHVSKPSIGKFPARGLEAVFACEPLASGQQQAARRRRAALAVGRLLLADCCWPLGHRLLAACHMPATIGRHQRPLATGRPLLTACCSPLGLLTACYWPPTSGHLLLAACYWLPVPEPIASRSSFRTSSRTPPIEKMLQMMKLLEGNGGEGRA